MQTSPLEELKFEALRRCSPRDLSLCSTKGARELISFEDAAKAKILPLGIIAQGKTNILIAACTDVTSESTQKAQFLSGMPARLVEVNPEQLAEAIFIAYKREGALIENSLEQCQAVPTVSIASSSFGLSDVSTPENHLLCTLLDHALAWDATDLHIHPTKDGLSISMRVAGEVRCREATVHNHQLYARLLNRLKIVASIDTAKKDPVLEGSLLIPHIDGNVTARISMVSSLFGESLAVRFLRKNVAKGISELGFTQEARDFLEEITELRDGLCIVAGATGAGKTTTLYALLQEFRSQKKRIITVEDPVEAILPGITQIQIDKRRGVSFENALKAVLRQDPDIIVIGEIREATVAREAMVAATSGHLVLATIHGGSINDIALRFQGWCPDLDSSKVVRALIHQTLKTIPDGRRVPIVSISRRLEVGGNVRTLRKRSTRKIS